MEDDWTHTETRPKQQLQHAMTWTPEGKRTRGGPKTTWRRTVEKERAEAGWRS